MNTDIKYTMRISDGQHEPWVEDVLNELKFKGAPDLSRVVSPVDRAKETVAWWNRTKHDGEPLRKLVAVYMVTTEELRTR